MALPIPFPRDVEPMLKAFSVFSKLPSELRALVWTIACENEASSKVLLIRPYGQCSPGPRLQSIIVAVSRESRACAQLFYKTAVPIFTTAWEPRHPKVHDPFGEETGPKVPRDHHMTRLLNDIEYRWCHPRQHYVSRRGTLYLNLRYTTVILGLDTGFNTFLTEVIVDGLAVTRLLAADYHDKFIPSVSHSFDDVIPPAFEASVIGAPAEEAFFDFRITNAETRGPTLLASLAKQVVVLRNLTFLQPALDDKAIVGPVSEHFGDIYSDEGEEEIMRFFGDDRLKNFNRALVQAGIDEHSFLCCDRYARDRYGYRSLAATGKDRATIKYIDMAFLEEDEVYDTLNETQDTGVDSLVWHYGPEMLQWQPGKGLVPAYRKDQTKAHGARDSQSPDDLRPELEVVDLEKTPDPPTEGVFRGDIDRSVLHSDDDRTLDGLDLNDENQNGDDDL